MIFRVFLLNGEIIRRSVWEMKHIYNIYVYENSPVRRETFFFFFKSPFCAFVFFPEGIDIISIHHS